jgi:hypothetical protein
MEEFSLPVVNRSVIIVKVRDPYVTWANQLPDRSDFEKIRLHSLESLNEEPAAFLVPDIYDSDEWDAYLETRWPVIFEHMLGEWTTDSDLWPKKPTLKMFHKWFEIILVSMVHDLPNKEPLDYQEI